MSISLIQLYTINIETFKIYIISTLFEEHAQCVVQYNLYQSLSISLYSIVQSIFYNLYCIVHGNVNFMLHFASYGISISQLLHLDVIGTL